MRTGTPNASSAELLMISVPTSSILTRLFLQMIPGKRSDLVLLARPNSKPSNQKTLVAVLLKRSFAELEIGRKRIRNAINAANDHLIVALNVVRIEIEIEVTVLTAVTVRDLLAIAAARNPTHTKRTVARPPPSAKRTIVSPAWLRVYCLTADHRILTENVTYESVTVTAIASEIGTGKESGTETIPLDPAATIHQVTTKEKDGTVKRNVNECIGVGLSEPLSKSYLMAMNARPPLAAVGLMTTTTLSVVNLETQRSGASTEENQPTILTLITETKKRENTP